jgi:integrase
MQSIGRPHRKPRLPVVLSQPEVAAVLAGLDGTHRVLAQLLYGTGMHIDEALQLRIKDVELDRRVVVVRSGKGGKDRLVMLPATLAPGLRAQMHHARLLWEADARASRGGVQMRDCKRAVQAAGITPPGHAAHAASCVRHALAAIGHRHTHGAEAARAQRRQHDDDLHPCGRGRRRRRQWPATYFSHRDRTPSG